MNRPFIIWGAFKNYALPQIRLIYLKPGIWCFSGAKTQTGQTAPKKEVVLSKLNLKFSAHSD